MEQWCNYYFFFQISHCDAKHIRGLVVSKPTLATMSVRFSATLMKVSATCFSFGNCLQGRVLYFGTPHQG